VVHKPQIYKDFFLDNDREYGLYHNKAKYPICNHVSYHRIYGEHKLLLKQISVHSYSSHFSEASKDPKWVEAMKKEIEVLHENNT